MARTVTSPRTARFLMVLLLMVIVQKAGVAQGVDMMIEIPRQEQNDHAEASKGTSTPARVTKPERERGAAPARQPGVPPRIESRNWAVTFLGLKLVPPPADDGQKTDKALSALELDVRIQRTSADMPSWFVPQWVCLWRGLAGPPQRAVVTPPLAVVKPDGRRFRGPFTVETAEEVTFVFPAVSSSRSATIWVRFVDLKPIRLLDIAAQGRGRQAPRGE